MFEVEIHNFQSIESLSLKIDGFTVLVGPSNIGKSAVVRAIKTALTNALGTDFVRHDQNECARILRGNKNCKCFSSVRIKKPGFDLLWEKGDAVNCYKYNGRTYDRPDRGMPDFLVEAGFAPVKIGDDAGSIQFADQFFPIFLLNQSGPAIAEAVSDVARLDRINTAMRKAEKDRRDAASTRKVREDDVRSLRDLLKGYVKLDEDLGKVRSVAAQMDLVRSAQRKHTDLIKFTDSQQSLIRRAQALWNVGTIPIPDFAPIQTVSDRLREVSGLFKRKFERDSRIQSLDWVDSLSLLPFEPVAARSTSLKQLFGWVKQLRSFKDQFARLEPVIRINSAKLTADLELIDGALTKTRKIRGFQVRSVELYPFAKEFIVPEPDVNSFAKAQVEFTRLNGYANSLQAMNIKVQTLQQEYEGALREESLVQKEIKENGWDFCSKCEQPFHSDLLGREAHSHV